MLASWLVMNRMTVSLIMLRPMVRFHLMGALVTGDICASLVDIPTRPVRAKSSSAHMRVRKDASSDGNNFLPTAFSWAYDSSPRADGAPASP
jgi:hypothetical protein